MRSLYCRVYFLLWIAVAATAIPINTYAQTAPSDDEPQAPSSSDDEPSEPAPPPTAAPAPNAPAPGPSTAPINPDEPGGSAEEPGQANASKTLAEPETPAEILAANAPKKTKFGLGFQTRAIFVPTWFLKLFFAQATPLTSVALSAEFIVRFKGKFDLITALDYGFYAPSDGNFLGKGENAQTKTDYVQYRRLDVVAFSAIFIAHHHFTNWLSLVYGGGAGLAIVLSDVWRVSNGTSQCATNPGDENACRPVTMTDPAKRDEWLSDPKNQRSSEDSPQNPGLYRDNDIWPVMPAVHLLVGLDFKITDHFSIRTDLGFRNAFYGAVTGHYFF